MASVMCESLFNVSHKCVSSLYLSSWYFCFSYGLYSMPNTNYNITIINTSENLPLMSVYLLFLIWHILCFMWVIYLFVTHIMFQPPTNPVRSLRLKSPTLVLTSILVFHFSLIKSYIQAVFVYFHNTSSCWEGSFIKSYVHLKHLYLINVVYGFYCGTKIVIYN